MSRVLLRFLLAAALTLGILGCGSSGGGSGGVLDGKGGGDAKATDGKAGGDQGGSDAGVDGKAGTDPGGPECEVDADCAGKMALTVPCQVPRCAQGVCVGGAVDDGTACDDGDACTEGEVCLSGICAGEAVSCTDDEPCTEDGCDPKSGCTFSGAPLDGTHCDDDDLCTEADVCTAGVCAGTAKDCDDGEACTADGCDASSGDCLHDSGAHEAEACDDGDPCTEAATCAGGSCAGTGKDCGDSNACTADTCDADTGDCKHDGLPLNGEPCEDGDACTLNDGCVGGACVPGAPADCDDGEACTVDACDTTTGVCSHDAKAMEGLPCDDEDLCTPEDACAAGVCVPGSLVDCDDANACTADSCPTETGICGHDAAVMDGSDCSDANPCTTGDTCGAGSCLGTWDDTVAGCAAGESCAKPAEVGALPFSFDGSTDGFTGDFDGVGCPGSIDASFAGGASSDAVFRFTVPEDGLYEIRLADLSADPEGLDALLYLYDGCPGAEGSSCIAGEDLAFSAGGESIRRPLVAGAVVFVVVDGWSSTDDVKGSFRLEIERLAGYEFDCVNGADDDGDDNTDCDDDDCAKDLFCVSEGELCGKPLTVGKGDPVTVIGDTTAFDDDHDTSLCGGSFTAAGGHDVVYAFAAPLSGRYRFAFAPTASFPMSWDSALWISRSCPPVVESCAGFDDGLDPGSEAVELSIAAGETVYAVVDGADAASSGPYRMTIDLLSAAEILCADGSDDDGDGLTDCDDLKDCLGKATCPGSSCQAAVGIDALPFTFEGSTTGATQAFALPAETCPDASSAGQTLGSSGAGSADMAFSFVSPVRGSYRFALADQTGAGGDVVDAVLILTRETCDLGVEPEACVAADDQIFGGGEQILAVLDAGVTYFVIVDGWSDDSNVQGPFVLQVEAVVETSCVDLLDDDGDGMTDCGDPDCSETADCAAESACDDAVDNDLDTFTDCDDTDCDGDPACKPAPSIAGSLVFTEVHGNPASAAQDVSETLGEWIEILNPGAAPVQAKGLILAYYAWAAGEVAPAAPMRFGPIDQALEIAAGGYVVFARSADAAENGGLAPAWSYGALNIGISNSKNVRLQLVAPPWDGQGPPPAGQVLDSIDLPAGSLDAAGADGRSWQLDLVSQAVDPAQIHVFNDDPTKWCNTPADPANAYATDNYGTPGAVNPACPAASSGGAQ